jgi:glycosyltransferase involved in cell wall biosynthesis
MLVIHSEDDSGSMLVEDFKGWGKKDMQRRYDKMRDYVYNRIDKVVYISKKAYDASCLPPSKKTFVYNGVPSLPYDLSYTSKEVVNFVCVGSMEGRKGQNIIVEALHALPKETLKKLHVTFVGGGSEELKLERLVETYDLANVVTFLGKRNDVPDILKTKDVFIMPSTVEGLPMSAIEALRAGLFLILTDTGGNKELCAEGCGYVCERTPQDVMEKILCVINNNIVSTEQKVHNHQRFVEEFSLECMAKNYEKNIVCLMKDSYDRK